MTRLPVVVSSVFSIIFLFTLFNSIDGVPFQPQIDNELSDESEIKVDTALMIKSRNKRDIMQSMVNTIWNAITYPFRMMSNFIGGVYNFIYNIVMMPINYIGGIISGFIDFILSPFRLIYRAITWALSFFYTGKNNPELEDASNNSSSLSTEEGDDSTFLERVEVSLRDWLIDMAWKAWAFTKETILPKLDEFIVTLTESTSISDNIKSILNSAHSLYQMLHLLKIL